jgi:DNA-binding transcriptional LysR family regulator
MELDPRRLRVLLAVVRGRGVVGASKALHLTPQAVSQQLGILEDEVGAALFDRTHRRLEPTTLGLTLATHAERIESELTAARRAVAGVTGRAAGTVRIAAFQSAIQWLVVEALPLVRSEQPGVVPMVIELSGSGAEKALRAGHVDLVIDERHDSEADPRASSLAVCVLRRDPYQVVASQRLARTLRGPKALSAASWIAAPEGTSARVALNRLAKRLRFEPRIAHVCLEFPSVLALVAAGEGAAVVPDLALNDARSIEVCPPSGIGSRRLLAIQRTSKCGTEPAVDAVTSALRAH